MATNLRTLAAVATDQSVSDETLVSYLRAELEEETVAEVRALRAMAEKTASDMTGRAILNCSYLLTLAEWPERFHCNINASRLIELPRTPLVSVTSVKYYDADGVQRTLDAGQYLAITSYEPGAVYLKTEYEWPEISKRPDAIQIEFIAGTGLTTSDTDPAIAQAIKLLARHYFSGGSPNLSETKDGLAAERILLALRVSGFVK